MPDEFDPTDVPNSPAEIAEDLSAPNPDDSADHRISGSYSLTGEPLTPSKMPIAQYEADHARAAKLWTYAIVNSSYANDRYSDIVATADAEGRLGKLLLAVTEVALEVDPTLKHKMEAFWAAEEKHVIADAAAQFAHRDGTGPDAVTWPGEDE